MDKTASLVCAFGPCTSAGTMACLGCKGLGSVNTYYCSKKHQKLDWSRRAGGTHKVVCLAAQRAAAAAAAAAAGGNAALGNFRDEEGPAIAADPVAPEATPEATAAAETGQVQALPCLSALVRAVRCRAVQRARDWCLLVLNLTQTGRLQNDAVGLSYLAAKAALRPAKAASGKKDANMSIQLQQQKQGMPAGTVDLDASRVVDTPADNYAMPFRSQALAPATCAERGSQRAPLSILPTN